MALSSCMSISGKLTHKPLVYCLNPKTVTDYRKSFVDMNKTDPLDAYIIADFALLFYITFLNP
ncbi:transposase [Clostridium sp. D2Q-14]|nr:transposase [Anaeromonas gelatinilytica]